MSNGSENNVKVSIQGTTTEPKDFSEGGSEHRKAIVANAALIVVLLSSVELKPALLGVAVSVPVLWLLIGVSHIYFFCMWRLTAPIEFDTEKAFWNVKGIYRQATIWRQIKDFPGKTKAQVLFLRALPIWAFLGGLLGVGYGLLSHFRCT